MKCGGQRWRGADARMWLVGRSLESSPCGYAFLQFRAARSDAAFSHERFRTPRSARAALRASSVSSATPLHRSRRQGVRQRRWSRGQIGQRAVVRARSCDSCAPRTSTQPDNRARSRCVENVPCDTGAHAELLVPAAASARRLLSLALSCSATSPPSLTARTHRSGWGMGEAHSARRLAPLSRRRCRIGFVPRERHHEARQEGAVQILCTSPEPLPRTCIRWPSPFLPAVWSYCDRCVRAALNSITAPSQVLRSQRKQRWRARQESCGFDRLHRKCRREARAFRHREERRPADALSSNSRVEYANLCGTASVMARTHRANSIPNFEEERMYPWGGLGNRALRSSRDSRLCASGPSPARSCAQGLLHRGAERIKQGVASGRWQRWSKGRCRDPPRSLGSCFAGVVPSWTSQRSRPRTRRCTRRQHLVVAESASACHITSRSISRV